MVADKGPVCSASKNDRESKPTAKTAGISGLCLYGLQLSSIHPLAIDGSQTIIDHLSVT